MTTSCAQAYTTQLVATINDFDWQQLTLIKEQLLAVWHAQQSVFICGNGGSAANADHIANDLSYGVNPSGRAFNIESLPANNAVTSCLANDTGFDNIFAQQLFNKAKTGDVLIVLSGSGNSVNIIKALEMAKSLNMKTCAILGFDGGKAKELADYPIHFPVMDMQISEDLQLMVGHILMKDLNYFLRK